MLLARVSRCKYLRSISLSTLVVFLSASSQVYGKMMHAAAIDQPGGPEKLYVGEAPIPALRQKEVLIRVITTAINRADTLQRAGRYPPPAGESSILGLEAAGVVDKLGPGATKWKIGDRVMALLSGGGNAEYAAAHEDHMMPVPEGLSFLDAGAIPEVWLTAYQLLHTVGQLRSGETVLIHAGGSGVGTAAVQLAKLAGATSYITAGSSEKIEKAISLGATGGFNYKEEDFSKRVLEATGGNGVDVILDCVGGSYWEKNSQAIATEGRWVLFGLMGGPKVDGNLLAMVLRKRISILGSTLRVRSVQYKADLVEAFRENALPHFVSGGLKTIIHTEMALSEIAAAHQLMESNANTGKIVIRVSEHESHDEL